MSTVITVENLSKKYIISHQQGGDNSSLREAINNSISSFGRKLLTPFRRSLTSCPLPHDPSFRFPASEDFWALKDVTFDIKRGERIGIIGRNGAGKSTLLKILSRITDPTTGSARIRGRVASLLEVGTGFHPELTGRENVFLNGAILGMSRQDIRKKFDEIVEFSEISKFLDTPVKRYSSGMYVRLAFAVAAHLEPEILIVDEVLAVGDAAFQKKCLGKMEEVGREGRTVLFVSHNIGAVTHLCEKGILLKNGQIAAVGGIRAVVNDYMSEYKVRTSNFINLNDLDHGGPRIFSSLQHLSVFDQYMSPCTVFEMDQTIIVFLQVEIMREVDDVEIGLKITNLLDMAIHYYVSTWEGMKLKLKKGSYTFEIRIDNIRIFPGKYILGAWVSRDGYYSDDNISGMMSIEVVSSDITGNFKALNIKNNFDKYIHSGCEVYAPSKWSIIYRSGSAVH